MARVILILALALALILAVGALMRIGSRVLEQMKSEGNSHKVSRLVPPFVSKVTYIVLIILMFSAAAGGLGGF